MGQGDKAKKATMTKHQMSMKSFRPAKKLQPQYGGGLTIEDFQSLEEMGLKLHIDD